MLSTIIDGRYPAAPLRWTRLLLGVTALFVACDGWFALQEANDGVAIRTVRTLPRLAAATRSP